LGIISDVDILVSFCFISVFVFHVGYFLKAFVLMVTTLRELYDDFKRFVRDREINGQKYFRLTSAGKIFIFLELSCALSE